MNKETTKQIGDKGEDLAVSYLEKAGYQITGRNWRTRFGEIDIITKKDGILIFVEVKAKKSDRYGGPGEMITARKLRKLKNTALAYIKEVRFDGPWRIDAVLIQDNKAKIIENITL